MTRQVLVVALALVLLTPSLTAPRAAGATASWTAFQNSGSAYSVDADLVSDTKRTFTREWTRAVFKQPMGAPEWPARIRLSTALAPAGLKVMPAVQPVSAPSGSVYDWSTTTNGQQVTITSSTYTQEIAPGFWLARTLQNGRYIAAGASERRKLKVAGRTSEAFRQIQLSVGLGAQPGQIVTASSVACSSAPSITGSQYDWFFDGLVAGAVFAVECDVTITNTTSSPARWTPRVFANAHLSFVRTLAPAGSNTVTAENDLGQTTFTVEPPSGVAPDGALHTFAQRFVTLIGENRTVAPGSGQESCTATEAATTTVYLPNITKTLGGPTGWVTPFIVQNVGTAPTMLELSFYSFATGALVTCRRVGPLLPGTSFADIPNADADLPDNSQFSVVVRAFGAPVVAVVNEHAFSGPAAEALSYVGASSGATRVFLPFVSNTRPSGWLTTFIMQNLGAATASVTIRLVTFCRSPGFFVPGCREGDVVTLSRSIPPGRSQFVNPENEPSLSGVDYAATLSSDQPIAVVVNAHRDGPMSFSYNGVAMATDASVYLPYVARNSGNADPFSFVFIQNAGSSSARPQVELIGLNGGQRVQVTAPSAIEPGASWVFDPRIHQVQGGYMVCPTAGTSTCARPGDHAAVITGGTFAAMTMTHTGSSFDIDKSGMGYTAPPRASRLYLPNVTRTLGGTSGWTTPIVLQSSGATAATLNWYRFSDGALVTTQQLTGLTTGASVRIDPRTVAGLSDNAQYAVTVDATGGSAGAIVTELDQTGGDGAMIYEGLTAP